MKIKIFDRETTKSLAEAVKRALLPVEEEFGVKVTPNGARFSEDSVSMKLNFLITDSAGVSVEKIKNFKRCAHLFGLKGSDFGAEIEYIGKTYRIVGLNPKSSKYPILADDVLTGKSYRLPLFAVRRIAEAAGR